MRVIKIGKNGCFINSQCPKGNKNVTSCKRCGDLLSEVTFYGTIKKVVCRGAGINKYNHSPNKKVENDG